MHLGRHRGKGNEVLRHRRLSQLPRVLHGYAALNGLDPPAGPRGYRAVLMMMQEFPRAADDRGRSQPRFLVSRVLFLLICLVRPIAAQEREPAPKRCRTPLYPRTNLATGYEVVRFLAGASQGYHLGRNGRDRDRSLRTDLDVQPRDRCPFKSTRPAASWCVPGARANSASRTRCASTAKGYVWLVDSGLHVVRKFTPEGKLLLTLGTPGEPGEDSTHLNRPTDVAVTPGGDIFVADGYGNNRVVHFDERRTVRPTWGSLGVWSRTVQPAAFDCTRFTRPALRGRPQQRRACRSSIRPAGFWMNGATSWSPGTSSSPSGMRFMYAALRPCAGPSCRSRVWSSAFRPRTSSSWFSHPTGE